MDAVEFIANKPSDCESNCNAECIYNGKYSLRRRGVISLDCDYVSRLTERVAEECATCGHKAGCDRDGTSKANCALDFRPRERFRVRELPNEKIIEYLECLPSPKCNHSRTDAYSIAENMVFWADMEMFDQTHGHWDGAYHPEEFMDQARAEAKKNQTMTFGNMGDFALECVNCPDDISAFCRGALPEGWVGFPDIYFAEAARRKILSQIKDSKRK